MIEAKIDPNSKKERQEREIDKISIAMFTSGANTHAFVRQQLQANLQMVIKDKTLLDKAVESL